jgi:hypothetical protein
MMQIVLKYDVLSVSLVKGLGTRPLRDRCLIPCRTGEFPLLQSVLTALRAHLTCFSLSTGVNFPGLKRSGRETYHKPASSAEAKHA